MFGTQLGAEVYVSGCLGQALAGALTILCPSTVVWAPEVPRVPQSN